MAGTSQTTGSSLPEPPGASGLRWVPRRDGVTVRLDGIDLVIFDKDGTLIEFHAMWSGWAITLADDLRLATGQGIQGALFGMLGYDPATASVMPGGGLAATPMARLRERTHEVLVGMDLTGTEAERALDAAWHAPDPVGLARPLTDLHALFRRLRGDGRRIAVATSDDREPSERTLAALGVAQEIDAMVCADDGVPVKPAPDMVLTCAPRPESLRTGPRSSATRRPTCGWRAPPAPA